MLVLACRSWNVRYVWTTYSLHASFFSWQNLTTWPALMSDHWFHFRAIVKHFFLSGNPAHCCAPAISLKVCCQKCASVWHLLWNAILSVDFFCFAVSYGNSYRWNVFARAPWHLVYICAIFVFMNCNSIANKVFLVWSVNFVLGKTH